MSQEGFRKATFERLVCDGGFHPFMPLSPTGSIYEMHCVRNPVSTDDEMLSHLLELSALGNALVGDEQLRKDFPTLAPFSRQKDGQREDRYVAVSMQRWPPEKIHNKEGKDGKNSSTGFSPAALQELQLLTQLHSLIPSPTGHPNLTLPIAVALPQEIEENGDQKRLQRIRRSKGA